MGLVHDAVEHRVGHGWVWKEGVPLFSRVLARDEQRPGALAPVHQF
jgi:hypothetical protein